MSPHFFSNSKAAAKKVLSVNLQLYDGAVLNAKADDTMLVFKTALKESKVALSSIRYMKYVGQAVTTRRFSDTNKFEIHCVDGCKLIGIPKSSAVIHLNGANPLHERGHVALWEIDFLEVFSNEFSPALAA
ncbi:MAG: hypothetical protein ACRENG_22075 [bacterium]